MILEKIKKICNEHRIPSVHSDFQIANFIIGKETSLVGKQWQCLRELQSRKDSLELVENEIEEINDNIEFAIGVLNQTSSCTLLLTPRSGGMKSV